MASGNKIVVTPTPGGVFKECIISGTPKPGTVMQLKASTEPVGGRHTYEVYNKAGDGYPALIAVLLEDRLQGKIATDAYVDGDRGFLYCPLPGDELNMLIADVAGTGATSDYAIGDLLQVADTTGLLEDRTVGTAFNFAIPFEVLETITDMSGDTLVHCQFTGY